ncbi:MAG TPA: polysaccharide biosynthesis C-terminal domain-containing protein [Bacteroidales bacterium]|nr:polysaccharide biosynthesis C-terminal domain-containing protein [Bacteroidales bacterium]
MIIRNILSTGAVRLLNAVSGFVLLWLATNGMGAAAWGVSGLILLNVTLLIMLAEMVSNAVVYYSSRRNVMSLMRLSIGFAMALEVLFSVSFFALSFFPSLFHLLVPQGYAIHILVLVGLGSLHNINLYLLLGRERIGAFNTLFLLQFLSQLVAMAAALHLFAIRDERAYVVSLYASYLVPLAVAYPLYIFPLLRSGKQLPHASFRELIAFGSLTQTSSFVHMLNRRLSFYVIRYFTGNAALGVFNSGVQLTEGFRLIGHSIALVQFSSISNSTDDQYALRLTIKLMKLSFLLTLFFLILLLLVPSSVFGWLFSREFGEIRIVVAGLAPGVLALSVNAIFSHYFSGTGRPKYNLYASLTGFAVVVPALYLLVPPLGILGGALAASMAYAASAAYQLLIFTRLNNTPLRDWLPGKEELIQLKQLIQRSFGKQA